VLRKPVGAAENGGTPSPLKKEQIPKSQKLGNQPSIFWGGIWSRYFVFEVYQNLLLVSAVVGSYRHPICITNMYHPTLQKWADQCTPGIDLLGQCAKL